MKVEVLMAVYQVKDIKEIGLKKKNIKQNCLIINQMSDMKPYDKDSIRMYSYMEKGISKSRNRAIEKTNANIGIITDDDISFIKNYEAEILELYKKYDADIITFNMKIGDKVVGDTKFKKHNFKSIMQISSCQVSMNLDSIKKHNLKFDEDFGIASTYKMGEENIFLNDCLKKGLKMVHVPILLNEHPDEATTGELWDSDTAFAKGAFSYRVLKNFHFIFLIFFLIVKHNSYKNNMSLMSFWKNYNLGLKDYKNRRKI